MLNLFKKIGSYFHSFRKIGETHNLTRSHAITLSKLSPTSRTGGLDAPVKTRVQGRRIRVLRTEDFHLNAKNFAPLLKVLKEPQYQTFLALTEKTRFQEVLMRDIMNACGQYEPFMPQVEEYFELVKDLDAEALSGFTYKQVQIFDCAVHEALSVCIAKPRWQDANFGRDREKILRHFFEDADDLRVLQNCCAIAIFWIEFWLRHRMRSKENIYTYDAVVLFSGAYIYGAVLIQLMAMRRGRCIICESLFTGNEFYFEELYRPIPNASRIGLPTVLNAHYDSVPDPDDIDRSVTIAVEKIRHMANKNVVQPDQQPLPLKLKGERVVLVIGQVVNDFSLLAGRGSIMFTIPAYRKIIKELLADGRTHVIFKAHPWERKKANIKTDFTKDALADFVSTLTQEEQDRVWIVSDWNIKQLFGICRHIVTICSQAAIEAALDGFKPITIGGTFYDSGRFCHSFPTVEAACAAINSDKLPSQLTLQEFKNFELYVAALLHRHTASSGPYGESVIRRTLANFDRKPAMSQSSRGTELLLQPRWESPDE